MKHHIIKIQGSVLQFDPKLPKLSRNQLQVLDLLVNAAEIIGKVYLLQENRKYPGANFYPSNATKEEILQASKKDKKILSPYTIVERVNGKLQAIFYHEKYKDLLVQASAKLNEAAKMTESKDFSKRLKIQAEVLLNGQYDEAMISWIGMKPYILDINIGPMERYDDKLFFIKTAYQAWVGVLDEGTTNRVVKYKDIILSARRTSLMPSEKVDFYDKVQARVDDVVIFSGLITRTMFVGVNLPNEVELMEKYGSEITIFKQVNELRFEHDLLPIYNKVFSSSFKGLYSLDDIEKGSLYVNVLHEIAHTYLRYRRAETRLQDLFPIIDELAAYVMGIKVCGLLLLKDIATQHQLESIMVAFLTRSFDWVLAHADDQARLHYVLGGAIFINYLLESGAVVESDGVSWPNFTKMFFALSELASVLERILSMGTRADAEKFIKKYSDLKKLRRFK